MKNLNVLGATGSIGDNTLSIVREYPQLFQVNILSAAQNYQKLAELAIEFKAIHVVIENQEYYQPLTDLLANTDTQVHAGKQALIDLVAIESDITIIGIVGVAALLPTMSAIKGAKVIGLANKECIICAGDFVLEAARSHNTIIIPVDSEHSALFQVLEEPNRSVIDSMLITASGGPFRLYSLEQMANVTPQQAVKHPNWQMGGKISVDSATLLNKGLEVIEAVKLFNIDVDKIEVVIHPESIIHGMINYADGSSLAQLSHPSMRTPVAYAMFYPNRHPIQHKHLRLAELATLNFSEPDYTRFPLLKLAREIAKFTHAEMTALNVANEVAVHAFLQGEISFLDISKIIHQVINGINFPLVCKIEDIFDFSQYIEKFTSNSLKIALY